MQPEKEREIEILQPIKVERVGRGRIWALTARGGGKNCRICLVVFVELHPKYLTTMTISREQVNSQSANESLLNKQVEHTCTHTHIVHVHEHEHPVIMMFFVEFFGVIRAA